MSPQKKELVTAEVSKSAKVGLVYKLFRKGLKEDPELQWDRIMDDMHSKDPWEDLKGIKHEGIRRKLSLSLWECVDFHKLTIYSIKVYSRRYPSTLGSLFSSIPPYCVARDSGT